MQEFGGDCNFMFCYSIPYSLMQNDVLEKPTAYILRGKKHRVTARKIASVDKMAYFMGT